MGKSQSKREKESKHEPINGHTINGKSALKTSTDHSKAHLNGHTDPAVTDQQKPYKVIRGANRDSFDRLSDELCEVILSYLPLEDKFMYECVSRVWQKCIFNRQTVLRISAKGRYDTLPQLLIQYRPHAVLHNKTIDSVVSVPALVIVLRKCRNIRKIKTEDCCPDNATTRAIVNHCPHLEDISLFCHITVGKKVLAKFGETLGAQIRRIRFADINKFTGDEKTKVEKILSYCPNIESLQNPEISLPIATKQYYPRLTAIEIMIKTHSDLVKLILLADKYGQQITVIKVQIYIAKSFRHFDKTMEQLARFKSVSEVRIKIYYYDLVTITIDDGLYKLAESCTKLKKLDFKIDANFNCKTNILHCFGWFKTLHTLIIQIDLNAVDFGSIRSLRHLTRLTKLTIAYQHLEDEHLKDIDVHCPRLKSILFVSQKFITDKTLNSLANIGELDKLKIKGNYEFNEFATDSGVLKIVENCPIRTLFFKCKPNISQVTLDAMIEKARQSTVTAIKFSYGYDSENDYRDIYDTQQLPENVTFILNKSPVRKWKYLRRPSASQTPKKLSFDIDPNRRSRAESSNSSIKVNY